MAWPVDVTFSLREALGFVSEGGDLESPFVGVGWGGRGRARAGRGVKYPEFFWGGEGEGRGRGKERRERVSFFVSCFLSSFPPSFLPSFLAGHDRILEGAFSLFFFLWSFFPVEGGDASARA